MKFNKAIGEITVVCLALVALVLPNQARAQFTGDYQTNIIDGTAVVWTNIYNVGSNYVSDALFITNGGYLSSQGAYIGRDSGANSNLVAVSTSGSLWTNWGYFYLGSSGSYNRLVISDGGKVQTGGNGPVVGSQSGSISNSVLVMGSGSVLEVLNGNDITIGLFGSHSSMVISNGGVVSGKSSRGNLAFIGYYPSSHSNTVLVTGSGSVWSNVRTLYVGNDGAGNTLVVSKGGALFCNSGYVGQATIATNNSVLITGSGSIWKMTESLTVGIGTNNLLTIADGGSVLAATNVYVRGASNNILHVSGGNLIVTNPSVTGLLQVGRGVLTFDSGTITADQLCLTNGIDSSFQFNSGTLHTRGTIVSNTQPCVVGDAVGSGTFHLVGGVHSFQDGLRIRTNSFLTGCGTINGSVVVEAGGVVHANCTNLVFNSSVTNNGTMVVDGAVLETFGTFVNNGKLFLLNGGTTNSHGTFINNGLILNGDVRLSIAQDGIGGLFVRYTGAPDVTYRLRRAASPIGPWFDLATNTAPASGLVEYHETAPPFGQSFYRTLQP